MAPKYHWRNPRGLCTITKIVKEKISQWKDGLYCTFPFKSTGGVMRDPFYLFDMSAAAEFSCDTTKFLAFFCEISSFWRFLGSFGARMTAGRFDKGPRDA
jgi:hypothetical protein